MNSIMKWMWLNGRFASCHAHLKQYCVVILVTAPMPTLRLT